MSQIIHKHGDTEKHDGYMPNKISWLASNYDASPYQDMFHTPIGYGYRARRQRSFRFGTQKRIYHASSHGICMDSCHVGKSEF